MFKVLSSNPSTDKKREKEQKITKNEEPLEVMTTLTTSPMVIVLGVCVQTHQLVCMKNVQFLK
jgi:hypothetical protein